MEQQNNRQRFIEREKILRPLMVDVPHQDRLDASIKKFKKLIKDSGLLVEIQKNEYFRKNSDIKREKRMKARSRQHRKVMEEKQKYM